jgi:transposase
MGNGTVSINGLDVGVRQGYGSSCCNMSPPTLTWSRCCWIPPLCAPTLARQVLKKTGGQREQALGRSRGGFSTKIHILVDGLGNPLRLHLTAGQCHDSPHAQTLLQGMTPSYVIADRGYAGQPLVDWIAQQGAEAVIPPHQNAKTLHSYDTWLYRERHLVECFINKIKHFRRVFSRFDKLASRYLGFLHFVSTLIWLR